MKNKNPLKKNFIQLIALPRECWGFRALEPLAEVWFVDTILGAIYKMFRNDPTQVPGKPIWTYSL